MSAILTHRPSPPDFVADSASVVYRAWQFLSSSLHEGTAALLTLSVTSDDSDTAVNAATNTDSATVTNGSGSTGSNGNASAPSRQGLMDTTLTPEQQLEELVREHLDSVYRCLLYTSDAADE